MAKPNQPKEIKPKTEGGEAPKVKAPIDENMKVIIINLVTTVLICVLFLSVTYVMQSSLLNSKLSKLSMNKTENAADDSGDASTSGDDTVQRGVIVDLGDFILNLGDVSPRKYLKVNVALEVSQKPEDAAAAEAPKGGHGGEGAAPAVSPLEADVLLDKVVITASLIAGLN